ncbi:carbonic anhydrase [Flavobacterium aquicola]|uniref:Carbonic anhydrase n=1 Tax=Flavobacterium aquicola TaxID=1682742 RepID=A0A3E0ETT3_9FLAO|nr:carbonic anhydrase [Flavobacterium aquicola]REH00810.1 carbonic anhydrase [Flavobacterium aquicola]
MLKKVLLYLLFISVLSACNHTENTNLSPLQKLEEGNKRFVSGKPMHPDETLERLRELKAGQHPFAVVVSCSDSRVPAELVFDQGLGDIFSIRTAGNVIGDYELGSIEYAVEHLDCKLIVVMGHKGCGAIKAFIDSKGNYNHEDHIKKIVEYIESEKEENELVKEDKLSIDNAVNANVQHGVEFLKKAEPILKESYHQKKITIIGAVYDIENGKVTFDSEIKK